MSTTSAGAYYIAISVHEYSVKKHPDALSTLLSTLQAQSQRRDGNLFS
jgi:hypothetical protein